MWFVVLLVRMHCLGKKDAYAEDQSSMHWAGQLKLSDYTTRVNLVPLDRTEGFNIGHGHLPLHRFLSINERTCPKVSRKKPDKVHYFYYRDYS